jgi:hypothetical protein
VIKFGVGATKVFVLTKVSLNQWCSGASESEGNKLSHTGVMASPGLVRNISFEHAVHNCGTTNLQFQFGVELA